MLSGNMILKKKYQLFCLGSNCLKLSHLFMIDNIDQNRKKLN
jgi:hypothetical protein